MQYDIELNSEYTFDRFKATELSEFAYKASIAVAHSPGMYNPILLYGNDKDSRLFLLESIGNYIKDNGGHVLYTNGNVLNGHINDTYIKKVLEYLTLNENNSQQPAEELSNECDEELLDDFDENENNAALISDDCQYLSGKNSKLFELLNECIKNKIQLAFGFNYFDLCSKANDLGMSLISSGLVIDLNLS
jgi:chromosomal replication initiation ATPase DnaA